MEVTWNLGGVYNRTVYSNQIYGYERGEAVYTGRPTTWTGKIALPYPSDYGYAADLGTCTQTLYDYDNSACTSVNWMKSIFTSTNWLLTPKSSDFSYVWSFESSGKIHDFSATYNSFGVSPVLYLSPELKIESGIGTSSDPYRLFV